MKFKSLKFILITVVVSVFLMGAVYASTYTNLKKQFRTYYDLVNKVEYNKFLNSIGKQDYKNVNAGWCIMKPEHKKLIIGASGVVHCGAVTEGIDLGYDIIGFGGVTDDMIKEWVPKINKKYDKIIYYACTNTINLCCSLESGFDFVEAQNDIFATITEVYKLLDSSSGHPEMVIVEVKEIVKSVKASDNLYIARFNSYAKILNQFFEQRGFKTYNIPYEANAENSVDGGHFSNIEVYKDLLK